MLRYVTDRYGRDLQTYATVDEFLAMCIAVFGEAPELTERNGDWYDADGLVLEAL